MSIAVSPKLMGIKGKNVYLQLTNFLSSQTSGDTKDKRRPKHHGARLVTRVARRELLQSVPDDLKIVEHVKRRRKLDESHLPIV